MRVLRDFVGGVRGNRREGANVAKIDTLEIALALNAIALLVSDDDFKKIKPLLDRIENAVLEANRESEGKKDD